MESKENFKGLFGEFIWERINLAISQETETPAEIESSNKQLELFRKIRELLGDQNRQLILDYESEVSHSFHFEVEKAYRQGIKDGQLFKAELGI